MFMAAVLAVLVVAGVAYASIPDSSGVIHGCYQTNKGSLRVIDSSASCAVGETALNWSQTGPPGAQGVQGPPGPAGPSHAYVDRVPFVGSIDFGPSVFPTTITSVSVPAGSYVVYATGEYDTGEGTPGELICAFNDATPVTGWTAPTDGIGPYAIVDTVSLSSAGVIELDCQGGDQETVTPSMSDNKLVAVQVGGIN